MLKRLATGCCAEVFLVLTLLHFATCECPFPEKIPENVRIISKSWEDFNETTAKEFFVIAFECDPGYQLIGTPYIQCKYDDWTDDLPTCAKMKCDDPPVIKNADIERHFGVGDSPLVGYYVIYSCKEGFELNDRNASTLRCLLDQGPNGTQNAKWKGEMPFCKEKERCPDPGVSKHGFRKGDTFFVGNALQYSCQENYELEGNSKIRCRRGGRWSSKRPLCRPQEEHCEMPPEIPDGKVIGNMDGDFFRPGEEAEILCNSGYIAEGSEFILCERGGKWKEEFEGCIEISCDAPEPLANGTIPELLTTNQTSFPYLSELTYICDEGFRLVEGDSWRICDDMGWSGETPYCEAVKCPDPGMPENGDRIGNSFNVGDKVYFRCSTGYYLIGSIERHCKPNGQWNGELSRCDTPGNYCPNPGIPIKGYKNSTRYDMGDKVGFSCQHGYILSGSEVRECLPDGTWSGMEAICLGSHDFDNFAEVKFHLKVELEEKAEQQEKEIREYLESISLGRTLRKIKFPGRFIFHFAFDVSGSVGKHNFQKSVEFAKAIIRKVGISENGARAGALTFSSIAKNMFLPMDYKTTEDVLNALDSMKYTGGGTSANTALDLINGGNIPLVEGVLGKGNLTHIVFILTDGKTNMGGNPEVVAEALKKKGVEIYCIGITGSVKMESLYKIASASTERNRKHSNVYILENYPTLSWLIQDITNGTVDYSQCGLGMEKVGNKAARPRIVGGKVSTEPWPWVAALYVKSENDPTVWEHICGGSIVNPNFILTAAHCLFEEQSYDWRRRTEDEFVVKLGLTNVKNETFLQTYAVSAMYYHKGYTSSLRNFSNDIALLQLNRRIEYTDRIRPVCLPPTDLPENSPFYMPEKWAYVIGWGQEEALPHGNNEIKGKMSEALKELSLQIQPLDTCNKSLHPLNRKYFDDHMFCAGDGTSKNDTCHGDSGGPLMQSQLNSEGYLCWTQVGIVSWGQGCGQVGNYGFYVHVQKFMPWITKTIQEAQDINN